MLNTKLRRTSLVILAVVLMLSVFAMTAFAEGENNLLIAPNPAADDTVAADAPVDDSADLEADSDDVLNVENEETDKTAEGEESTDTAAPDTTGAVDDGHDHDHEEEEKGFTTSDLVLLIIFGVVVIIVAVVCIIKREKVGKFFRGIKSEFKKIVWSPWNQVRKNSLVVIVLVIVLAAIIGLLDFLFGQGITELKNLINP